MDSNTTQTKGSHTQNASLSAAVTLTPPAGANVLTIQPLTNNIRMTTDGTTPTASLGIQMAAGSIYVVDVGQDATIKIIEETASASVEYYWEQRKLDGYA